MAVINMDDSKVLSQGRAFEEYAENLLRNLREIDAKVQVIAERGIKGSAATQLMNRYEDIHAVINRYAQKIQQLGELIQSSARAKANVNEAAAKATGSSAV